MKRWVILCCGGCILPHQNHLIHQKLADADRDEAIFIIAGLLVVSHDDDLFTEKYKRKCGIAGTFMLYSIRGNDWLFIQHSDGGSYEIIQYISCLCSGKALYGRHDWPGKSDYRFSDSGK